MPPQVEIEEVTYSLYPKTTKVEILNHSILDLRVRDNVMTIISMIKLEANLGQATMVE